MAAARAGRRTGTLGWVLVAAGVLLAAVAVVVALRGGGATAGGPGGATTAPRPTGTWTAAGVDPEAYARELAADSDAARTAAGVPATTWSDCAADQARARAAALVGRDLEHAPLDGVAAACAPGELVAENLSRAAADPQDVVDAWLGSPGHRGNLLDPGLGRMGVGCVTDDGQLLCSQVFLAAPAAA